MGPNLWRNSTRSFITSTSLEGPNRQAHQDYTNLSQEIVTQAQFSILSFFISNKLRRLYNVMNFPFSKPYGHFLP